MLIISRINPLNACICNKGLKFIHKDYAYNILYFFAVSSKSLSETQLKQLMSLVREKQEGIRQKEQSLRELKQKIHSTKIEHHKVFL